MSDRQHRGLIETAEWLGVSPNTLRWWKAQGTGPRSFKIGRRVYYRQSDLDAFVEEAYAAGETGQEGAA
jgi:predicted DNA-binding transcriptional regulator AlpA